MSEPQRDVPRLIRRLRASEAMTLGLAIAAADRRGLRPLTFSELDELTCVLNDAANALADAQKTGV